MSSAPPSSTSSGGSTSTKSPRAASSWPTSLGKTLVARGVIAKTIHHLRKKEIPRIDIVYICSNADIARQNINRLIVTGQQEFALASRITLLPSVREGHGLPMRGEIVGEVTVLETIAVGRAIRELSRLQKLYGKGRWRKMHS